MILAFDTYYVDDKAKTICISFERWTSINYLEVFSEVREGVDVYSSGEFYKRELPCIISLLEKIDLSKVEFIVVDGFVFLDDLGKFGLGGYLFNHLECKIPIIGVAKNNFATLEQKKRILLRGDSKKPLYITSIGMDVDKATEFIKEMRGDFRIPTLLKELDRLTREVTTGN